MISVRCSVTSVSCLLMCETRHDETLVDEPFADIEVDSDVRPIAMGEIWRRLISKVAVREGNE